MSTITKTNFGQISFRAIVTSVGFEWLGHGKHASRCDITDGEDEDLWEMIWSTRSAYAWQKKWHGMSKN
jgi:hypothetical protein